MISGRLLVVDDNRLNRLMLSQHLSRQGHIVTLAEDGRQALSLLREQPFDLMLLDIMMPVMDGYSVLEQLHADPALRNLPVIVISALDEMESVVRCIGMGAADYLTKPFDPVLLRARIGACLENKRLRDLELEYLEQVGYVVDAAQAVEAARFDPASLEGVAARGDALGSLARVFQRMAREVHEREQRLRRQLEQLRLDMEEMRQAQRQSLACYLPADRQRAVANGLALSDRVTGAALFVDIAGFTPLAAELANELGRQRGAEELTRAINQVYAVLINEVHRRGGSVIGFAGDAITCWFDDGTYPPAEGATPGSSSRHAVACALAIRPAMTLYDVVTTPAGTTFALAVKTAVTAGHARRMLVGAPDIQLLEAIAGETLDRLAAAEHAAKRGEIVVGAEVAEDAGPRLEILEWREDDRGRRVAVVSGAVEEAGPETWSAPPLQALTDPQCRAWVPPLVYERLASGNRQFLSELRPVSALFLGFSGIDYDADHEAPAKLDAYVRWVQRVAHGYDGVLTHVTMGDKGSYLCLAFGAVVAHTDDEARAVRSGLRLLNPPPESAYIEAARIGIAAGEALVGTYGGTDRITYDVQGERVNLAARLMIAAPAGGILCDEEVFRAAREAVALEELPPIRVKGFVDPVPVFRPAGAEPASSETRPREHQRTALDEEALVVAFGASEARNRLDRLPPAEQLLLKVASILGTTFACDALAAVLSGESERTGLDSTLCSLEEQRLVRRGEGEGTYVFVEEAVRTAAYSSMLFAHRRHLHRRAAEWCEGVCAHDLAPHSGFLAHHWREAGEPAKAMDYLERAGRDARVRGDLAEAQRLLRESLDLDAEAAVLSASYYAEGARDAGGRSVPDVEGAVRYALVRLEKELSPELTYHCLTHTCGDVLPATRRIAASMRVDPSSAGLLEVAAAFHDIGFVHGTEEHERAGAEIAAQVLPSFGFSSKQTAAVQGMILATRLPQSPRSPLEEILADADLDNLGRTDGIAWSHRLRAEFAAQGKSIEAGEWYRRQLTFFSEHRYFTSAARESRDEGKRRNIEELAVLADAAGEE
jgi:CheY-like chemotaxis protein/class 3 adenylate cyclase/predicted metal-dependent HD superfamily phosphohydrolase